MNEKLIAPCGMNCKLCIAYQFDKKDLNQHGFHKKYCIGCLSRGDNCTHMKKRCELIGNGHFRFCYECENFPCNHLKSLDKRYRTKYHMSMIENLKNIKECGMDTFLKNQEIKWRCPECNDSICCHIGLCLNCNIKKLVINKKYRWEE